MPYSAERAADTSELSRPSMVNVATPTRGWSSPNRE